MYPERVTRCILYPSDVVFYSLWNIAKWFFDPVVREKMKPMMYLSGVEEYIDRQHIPVSMVSYLLLAEYGCHLFFSS